MRNVCLHPARNPGGTGVPSLHGLFQHSLKSLWKGIPMLFTLNVLNASLLSFKKNYICFTALGLSCGTWNPHCSPQALGHSGSVSVASGIFLTRDQTRVPCVARQIANHWTAKELAFFAYAFYLPRWFMCTAFRRWEIHFGRPRTSLKCCILKERCWDTSHAFKKRPVCSNMGLRRGLNMSPAQRSERSAAVSCPHTRIDCRILQWLSRVSGQLP